MNTSLKSLLAVVAVALPGVAFAQSSDAQYCAALVGKYEQYLDMSSKRGEQPQSLEAKTGIEKCRAGDPQAFGTGRLGDASTAWLAIPNAVTS